MSTEEISRQDPFGKALYFAWIMNMKGSQLHFLSQHVMDDMTCLQDTSLDSIVDELIKTLNLRTECRDSLILGLREWQLARYADAHASGTYDGIPKAPTGDDDSQQAINMLIQIINRAAPLEIYVGML